MELEYTWATLATATGCTAAVVLITQYVKEFLPKWLPTRIFVLCLSFVLLLCAWLFGTTDHNPAMIPLILINSFTISLAAMGAYATALQKKEEPVSTTYQMGAMSLPAEGLDVEKLAKELAKLTKTETTPK